MLRRNLDFDLLGSKLNRLPVAVGVYMIMLLTWSWLILMTSGYSFSCCDRCLCRLALTL